jgi:hypothetical protein
LNKKFIVPAELAETRRMICDSAKSAGNFFQIEEDCDLNKKFIVPAELSETRRKVCGFCEICGKFF